MLPTAKDVESLSALDQAEFERWLRIGLEQYFSDRKSALGFERLAPFIGNSDHVALDIAAIYDACDAKTKARFRNAVADLIAHLEPSNSNFSLFEVLFLIAAAMPAPEILRVLPSCLGGGALGRLSGEHQQSLIGTAISTAAELAAPTSDAETCVLSLISSAQFDSAYAGIALITLSRIAPEHLADHMNALRDALQQMFRRYNYGVSEKRHLARDIIDAVGIPNLLAAAPDLHVNYFDPTNDQWLFASLLSGPGAAVEIIESGLELYLRRSNSNSAQIRVPRGVTLTSLEPIQSRERTRKSDTRHSARVTRFIQGNAKALAAVTRIFKWPWPTENKKGEIVLEGTND